MPLNAFEIKYQKLHTKLYRLKTARDWHGIKEVQKEIDDCMDLAEQLKELHDRSLTKTA